MARTVEVAKQATFETDDKRAQYARLVVFNFGVKEKIISKDATVDSASNSDLQRAFKSLTGGTMLEGPGGIELIQKLTEKGSTTGRGLTKAYAQEVRPFLRRGLLAPTFGRRARAKSESNGGESAPKGKASASTGKASSSGQKKGRGGSGAGKRTSGKGSTRSGSSKKGAATPSPDANPQAAVEA